MIVPVATPALRRAQHDRELIVYPILQHHPHLPDKRAPSQHSVPVDGPEDESLEPDNEREQPALFATILLGEYDQHRHQHAGNREEKLEVLCEPSQEDIPPGRAPNHSDLVGLKTARTELLLDRLALENRSETLPAGYEGTGEPVPTTTSLGPGATVNQGLNPGGTALASPEAVMMRKCSINIEQPTAGVQPPAGAFLKKQSPT
jgi:hypothetical protein